MRRRWVALGAAAVALGLALVAALLAIDISGSRDAIRDGDVRHAAGGADPHAWEHDDHLPGDLAERLLGLRDDLAFRRAVALFVSTRPGGALPREDLPRARDDALQALTAAAGDRGEPSRAAQAANLAGILAAEAPDGASEGAPAEDALELFRASIRLNPEPEHAKRNLERLLRELRSAARAAGQGPERGGQFGRSPGDAGLSPPGEGY